MHDHLALLVGRVILAFGSLDERLTELTEDLQRIKTELGGTSGEVDRRFAHRLKLFRRLADQLTKGDASLLGQTDTLLNRIREAEELRALLAHSSTHLEGDRIFVYSQRLLDGYPEAMLNRKPGADLRAIWNQHHQRSFDTDELAALASEIQSVTMDLMVLKRAIRVKVRALEKRPTL